MSIKSQISIAQAQPSDLHVYARIHRDAFGEGYPEWLYKKILESPLSYSALAYLSDMPVGQISISWNIDTKRFCGDLSSLNVLQKYQNLGIGSLLLVHILAVAAETDFIYLHVKCDNANAIHLYEKFGFKNVARIKNYYQNENKDGFLYIRNQINHPILNRLESISKYLFRGGKPDFPVFIHEDNEIEAEPIDLSIPENDPILKIKQINGSL